MRTQKGPLIASFAALLAAGDETPIPVAPPAPATTLQPAVATAAPAPSPSPPRADAPTRPTLTSPEAATPRLRTWGRSRSGPGPGQSGRASPQSAAANERPMLRSPSGPSRDAQLTILSGASRSTKRSSWGSSGSGSAPRGLVSSRGASLNKAQRVRCYPCPASTSGARPNARWPRGIRASTRSLPETARRVRPRTTARARPGTLPGKLVALRLRAARHPCSYDRLQM